MKLRLVDSEKDYPTLVSWWECHGAPVVPQAVLPSIGFMAEIDGHPVAAVWLWMANCKGVCWLTWMVTKYGLTPREADEACSALVDHAQRIAADLNYGVMFAICPVKGGMKHLMNRMGFDAGNEEPHVHLMKMLPITSK